MYQRREAVSIRHQVICRHVHTPAEDSCLISSTLNLTVGDRDVKVPYAFIDSVTFNVGGMETLVTDQPFTNSTSTTKCYVTSTCPHCTHEMDPIDVSISLNFETMPAVTAGDSTRPPFVPAPVVKTYELEMSRKSSSGDDFDVRLVDIDYDSLYQSFQE